MSMDIAWEIKKRRMESGLTLYELEERSDHLHHTNISRIENGSHRPMFYTAERILDVLGYELKIVPKK